MRKKFATIVLSSILIAALCMPVSAQEDTIRSENPVITEFWEKKDAGLEVYELLDQNGNIVGYCEPVSDEEAALYDNIMPRYTSSINWTIPAGETYRGVNVYTLQDGDEILVNISQSQTGTSYLTFLHHESYTYVTFTNTMTTKGWNNVIYRFGDIETGTYSFGIENRSSNEITYSGSYTL